MSLQTNYWLQQLGFLRRGCRFFTGCRTQTQRKESLSPFYQPVDGKAFTMICGKAYDATDFPVKVFPVLPAKRSTIVRQNLDRYAKALDQVVNYFRTNKIF